MDKDEFVSGFRTVKRPLAVDLDAEVYSPSVTTSPVADPARNSSVLLLSRGNGTPCRRISWSSDEDTPPKKSFLDKHCIVRLNSAGSSSERSTMSLSGTESDDIEDGFPDIFDMDALESDARSSINDFQIPRAFCRILSDTVSSGNRGRMPSRQFSEIGQISPVSRSTLYCAESLRKHPISRFLSKIEESPVASPVLSPRRKLLECVDRNNSCGNKFKKPVDKRKSLPQDEDDHTFKKPCQPPSCMSDRKAREKLNQNTQETKRRKIVSSLTRCPSDSLVLPVPRNYVQRSHSETDAISRALQISTDDPELIGDCSGSYALPLVKGKHGDLKAISCTTLSNLMNGMYEDSIVKYQIVDCRYPYEFDGGHIKGACNLYTKESILENLIYQQAQPSSCKKRKILVFHCEFSSKRGPNLSRFLRKKDREANAESYPNLFYPEIYLLEGGYRDFFKHHKELCVPQSYLPMTSKGHESDLKKFRTKSKSWLK